jgi:hypothetical protein
MTERSQTFFLCRCGLRLSFNVSHSFLYRLLLFLPFQQVQDSLTAIAVLGRHSPAQLAAAFLSSRWQALGQVLRAARQALQSSQTQSSAAAAAAADADADQKTKSTGMSHCFEYHFLIGDGFAFKMFQIRDDSNCCFSEFAQTLVGCSQTLHFV